MTALQQLSEHGWVFPAHPDKKQVQPAVGVICGEDGTLLVDGANGPDHARAILAALDEINAPPLAGIIYTHFHWDHTFGAQTFGDVPIIAHRRCHERVTEYASRPWSVDYLEGEIKKRPDLAIPYRRIQAVITDWEAFAIPIPTDVFETTTHTVPLDGVQVMAEWVGGSHTDDSTIVRLPEEGVMYLSDAFYPSPASAQGKRHPFQLGMMRRFLEEEYIYYVDGHNRTFTHAEFEHFYERIQQRQTED